MSVVTQKSFRFLLVFVVSFCQRRDTGEKYKEAHTLQSAGSTDHEVAGTGLFFFGDSGHVWCKEAFVLNQNRDLGPGTFGTVQSARSTGPQSEDLRHCIPFLLKCIHESMFDNTKVIRVFYFGYIIIGSSATTSLYVARSERLNA